MGTRREAAERSYHYNEAIVDSPRGIVFHFIRNMSGMVHFQIGFDTRLLLPKDEFQGAWSQTISYQTAGPPGW